MANKGDILEGRYEIERVVGRGGMSVVYRATDLKLENKIWAVKEIKHDVYGEERQVYVDSLLQEANLMKKLNHPLLPRIVDIVDDNFVVMDYIEGESLDKVLERNGPQPEEQVLEWGKTLCEVLMYLHNECKPPVIYRDMKPSNIMLRPDGTIRVFDFGIAREYKIGKATDTVDLGTVWFAAPEQFEHRQTDARTDIYGLGKTLYNLLTNQQPAAAPRIREVNPKISAGMDEILYRSIQIRMEDRYQNAAEMLYWLEHIEDLTGDRTGRLKKKLYTFTAALICSGVFLAAGVITGFANRGVQNQNYQAQIDIGTKEGYKQAIALDPGKKDAYLDWIKIYKEQQVDENGEVSLTAYTPEEANELESVFDKTNLEKLKSQDPQGYAEVCYEAGLLCWYQLVDENGEADDPVNSKVRSVKWFQKVVDLNNEGEEKYLSESERGCAECYYNIACFFRDQNNSQINEASGKTIYRDYFDNVTELLGRLGYDKPNPDESSVDVLMRVQMYDLILYSLDSDIELFRNEGVTQKEAQGLYDTVAENNDELAVGESGVKHETKERIDSRLESAQKKIDMAYDVGEETEDER